MSMMRITQRLMTDRVMLNLNRHTRNLLDVQEKLSTGRRINSPSDDPIGVRRAINTRTIIQKSEQYSANIKMMKPQMSETTSQIQTILDNVGRAYELTLQAANSVYSQTEQDNLAEEINQVLESVLERANHRTNDRYIFAGTKTRTEPFEAIRNANGEIEQVVYRGNSEYINLAVSDTSKVAINEPGDRILQSAEADVFQTLIDIRDNMRAMDVDELQERLGEIETIQEQMLRGLARVGAAQNRIFRSEDDTEDYILANQILLSDTLDADFAETIIDLNVRQNAYQAALNAAGRTLQPSLLDFVR